ncbi:MAG TPA: MBL fold metallo-hydrolase [Miltoncostaea sp.]|nr:MBL fold metallo-hydrolase [Miltoncostaea sp.]
MEGLRITHVGGPTVLIERAGWTLLTDPTFDPAGGAYRFGWGTGSRKTTGPALAPADLPPLDAVLLTHDHHGDNLDAAGRALLPSAGTVVTTEPGARRLGGAARGLAPWATTRLETAGRPGITITATPCRHGPAGFGPVVGDVVGFALGWDGDDGGALWVTGDTVLFDGVRSVAGRVPVDVALVHMGGVRFPVTGPLRFTMTAAQAAELIGLVRPRVAVPVHYEGWAHFQEGRAAAERALADAPEDVRRAVRWIPIGAPVDDL